jgi:hypothetical protein
MSLDLLFTIAFPVVVPFWALMILAQWWGGRRKSSIRR